MPSNTTIINHLLRLASDGSADDLYKNTLQLSPKAEALSDPDTVHDSVEAQARGWSTGLAFETLRGWRWPFWINSATNPASPTYHSSHRRGSLENTSARDAALITLNTSPASDIAPSVHLAGTMDRRGMITPAGAAFSVEIWFRVGDELIVPSEQFAEADMAFTSSPAEASFSLSTAFTTVTISAAGETVEDFEYLRITASHSPVMLGTGCPPVAVYAALRPYNLEGVTPVHDLVYNSKGFWMSDNRIISWFPTRPDLSWASNASHGDAAQFLAAPPERNATRCPAGMATAFSAFHLSPGQAGTSIQVIVPVRPVFPREFPFQELMVHGTSTGRAKGAASGSAVNSKADIVKRAAPNVSADESLQKSSLHQLTAFTDVASQEIQRCLLHRNHWIVAAVRALIAAGKPPLAARLLRYCALGIQKNGYLPHGRGKWAFQGQFLTALADYYTLSGVAPDETILRYTQIKSAARWIIRKRREISHAHKKPAGLLPPGVTRYGVGTEYQLADNIWGIEGLEAATALTRLFNAPSDADTFHADAVKFAVKVNAAIHREMEYGIMQQVPGRLHRPYDASSAADLLDLAITHEARTLLKPDDWLGRLCEVLSQPLQPTPGWSLAAKAAGSTSDSLLQMDERGLRPARHIMLRLAEQLLLPKDQVRSLDHQVLTTPFGGWTEVIDSRTRMGVGRLIADPEGAALYLILTAKLQTDANNPGT